MPRDYSCAAFQFKQSAHAFTLAAFCAVAADQVGCKSNCRWLSLTSHALLSSMKVSVSKRIFQIGLLSAFAVLGAVDAQAGACPTAKDEIATDRPDVTNSSLVVPPGSLQSENGVNFSVRDGGRFIDGTNTRWRLGIAPCLELLLDLPTYFANIRAPGNSGFSDVAPAIKWQVSPIPGKFDLSPLFGVALTTGGVGIVGRGAH